MEAKFVGILHLAPLWTSQEFFENRPWKKAARALNKSKILKLSNWPQKDFSDYISPIYIILIDILTNISEIEEV